MPTQRISLFARRASRELLRQLHNLGLITLGLVENDPSMKTDGNTSWTLVKTDGIIDEHKLIGVLVGAEVASPGRHPMAETFHVVAHKEPRDPWFLFGYNHTSVDRAVGFDPTLSDLQGKAWSELSVERRARVERANKERYSAGEVTEADFFCLQFDDQSPAELFEYVVFSMPSSTLHGELRLPVEGLAPRFYVDELDLKRNPPDFAVTHCPLTFEIASETRR